MHLSEDNNGFNYEYNSNPLMKQVSFCDLLDKFDKSRAAHMESK